MKYCRYCGAEIEEDAKYCSKCGKKVDGTSFKQSFSNNMSSDLRNGFSDSSIKKQDISEKSRVVAAVLAFFVGLFGVHRIYLNHKRSGIAMLIVGIISSILVLTICLGSVFFFSPSTIESFFNDAGTELDITSIDIDSLFYSMIAIYSVIIIVLIIDFVIWIIAVIDFIKILLGSFKDGNGKIVSNW